MARANSRNIPLKNLYYCIKRLSRLAALKSARRLLPRLYAARQQFRQNRYYTRPKTYSTRNSYAYRVPSALQLPPDRFFQAFRMDKSELKHLSDKLADDPVFRRRGKKPQAPVYYQVALLVYRMAHLVEVGVLSTIFRCGVGTVTLWTDRVLQAFLRLRPTLMPWPSPSERLIIRRHFETFGLPECVGVIDGCKINLMNAPSREDKPAYHTYKERYALVCLFIVDHTYRIRYIQYGYPGSANDKRLQRLVTPLNEPGDYFDPREFILGDAGFTCGPNIVPLYHKSAKINEQTRRREDFNKIAAKGRVVVEQAIGILKGQFPALRNLNMTLKTPRDKARAHGMINAACMLHNLVLNVYPDANYDFYMDDDLSDDEDAGGGARDVQGSTAVPANQLRREEVCELLLELMQDDEDDS